LGTTIVTLINPPAVIRDGGKKMEKMSSSAASLYVERSFNVGFWHPFGRHAGEATDHILARKSLEAERNGFTIWSFTGPRPETVTRWREKVHSEGDGRAIAFCSSGKNARDPNPEPFHCTEYSADGGRSWERIPDGIRVPHPKSSRRVNIVGYFVRKVIVAEPFRPAVNVLYEKKDGAGGHFWKEGKFLPTKGNSLIKRADRGAPLREICAMLELEYPYVVMLR